MIIPDEDVEYIVGCVAAHPDQRGGQHVARHCTAVIAIHKPTGIAVRDAGERSQYKSKLAARTRLELVLDALTFSAPDVLEP